MLFESLTSGITGIDFQNNLRENEQWNIITFPYFYNGGGVAIGDINNDSLPDIYLTANQGTNKLYLNKGNFKFEDITLKAGVPDSTGWKTGVTMLDANSDGWLDIYVSHISGIKGLTERNKLFINNQNGTFTEQSEKYGLSIGGICIQAVFFDFDTDGDLDCYILRNHDTSIGFDSIFIANSPNNDVSSDILLRNYGGRYDDVSHQAGIVDSTASNGVGIGISDLNNDGLPDIYIGNDILQSDHLYYNAGKGKFVENIAQSLEHQAYFSAGNDIADFNNDGLPDIFTLDRKPEEEVLSKMSASVNGMNSLDWLNRSGSYRFQYPRNMLQMNRGSLGNNKPLFAEIGQFSGISETDWSWASLFSDFDNDGKKDLFITNGIARRINDLDYLSQLSNGVSRTTVMGLIKQIPEGKASNYGFKNKNNQQFDNVSENWGLSYYGLSTGAAYGDLDNDGDLDLVVNNVNDKALILNNKADKFFKNKYLKVKLLGKAGNTEGVGAKVIAYVRDTLQYLEQQPVRGYQSAVDPILNFGFYNAPNQGQGIDYCDSLRVIWGDGSTQLLKIISLNQTLTLRQRDAKGKWDYKSQNLKPKLLKDIVFQDITSEINITYKHRENLFYDNEKEKLIPHFLSTEGPKIAVGDVNNDGQSDFYICGAKGYLGQLFLKEKKGGYAISKQPAFEKDILYEDVGAALFDMDSDNDLDLYVVSGGNEVEEGFETARDRVYINDGKGNFSKKTDALPKFYHNGSCVKPSDFDGDGDTDIFVGSRSDMHDYGITPKSYLLENDGKGIFKEVPPQLTNGLDSVGMVTDAAWLDMNKDGLKDLVVVGEWMPITIFYYTGEDFIKSDIENTSGMWRCIEMTDLDNDGDQDLVLGNMGLNSHWRASRMQPMRLYVKDFDGNSSREPIITHYRQGLEWLFPTKDELFTQILSLSKRFKDYTAYANSPFSEIFTENMLNGAVKKEIQQLSSVCLMNKGGVLEFIPLPIETQLSTVESIFSEDFDKDGINDLAIGGNFYEMQPSIGRLDASIGAILRGDGSGNFATLNNQKTGWQLRGAVRDIRRVGNHIIVAFNNNALQVYELKNRN